MVKKPVLYPCDQCGKMVRVRSKGKCARCRQQELQANRVVELPKPLPKKSRSKSQGKRESTLHKFFLNALETLPAVSQESGTPISDFSKKNVCHILPKRQYHSVECELLNIVVLTWGEHSRFDYLLDNRDQAALLQEFPRTCALIRQRMPDLLPLVQEKGSLLNFLIQL